jgi:chromosome segregation ATPase
LKEFRESFRSGERVETPPSHVSPALSTHGSGLLHGEAASSPEYGAGTVRQLADQLDGVRRAWREEGTGLRARLLEMHRTRVALEQQLAECQTRLSRIESESREREAALSRDLRSERERLSSERRAWDDQAKEWQNELSRFGSQLSDMRDKYHEALQGRREAEGSITELQSALSARTEEAAAHGATVASFSQKIETLRRQLEDARLSKERELSSARASFSEERTELIAKLDSSNARSGEADARLRQANLRVEQLEADLESERRQASRQLSTLEGRLAEVETDRRRAISEAHRLRELLRVAESEFDAVASAVDEISSGKRTATTTTQRHHSRIMTPGHSPSKFPLDTASHDSVLFGPSGGTFTSP